VKVRKTEIQIRETGRVMRLTFTINKATIRASNRMKTEKIPNVCVPKRFPLKEQQKKRTGKKKRTGNRQEEVMLTKSCYCLARGKIVIFAQPSFQIVLIVEKSKRKKSAMFSSVCTK
jgi:hypothetical protein